MLFILCHSAFAETPVKLDRIESKRDRGFDYLDIYTNGWSEARGLLLENKLYIDFPGVKVGGKMVITRKKSRRIADIEVIQKDEKTARIIVTLKREVEYDIANMFGKNKSVVEIGDRAANNYAQQFAWESKEVKRKTKPLKPIKLVARAEAKGLPLRGKKIVINPGHGGEDPGAFSTDGIPEKELTLQIAHRAAKLLHDEGATVYMTRNDDSTSNLKDITEYANKTRADIFIAIHYNSTYGSGINGTETYYYNPISRELAEYMHEAVVRGIRRKDHGMHRTPFYVVKNTDMPAVLLEPIYISNPEESYLSKSASFQSELGEAILKGVESYFRNKPN